jgi:hypothetical protein
MALHRQMLINRYSTIKHIIKVLEKGIKETMYRAWVSREMRRKLWQ